MGPGPVVLGPDGRPYQPTPCDAMFTDQQCYEHRWGCAVADLYVAFVSIQNILSL